jgi:TatD DNase family protein
MTLFDGHCHLDFPAFDGDREEVLRRAADAGVGSIFVPGVSPDNWAKLSTWFEGVESTVESGQRHMQEGVALHCGIGLHPWQVDKMTDMELSAALIALPHWLWKTGAVAVGECGLDAISAKRTQSPITRQRVAFQRQISLAKEQDLPLVVHAVRAHGEVLKMLQGAGPFPAGGVVHSYSGAPDLVPLYVELGFYLSFSASVVPKDAKRARQAARRVPPDRIMVETDSPDQSPPGRSRRNEPAWITDVIAVLAQERDEDPEELGARCAENAGRVYRV